MNPNLHLNEAQIDDVLIGDATNDTSTHLASCAECRERLAAAAQPMESFAALTLAWSERQSATMSAQPLKASAAAWPRRWNWALAAAVLLVVGLLLPLSQRDTQHKSQANTALSANIATPATSATLPTPQAAVQPDTQPAAQPVAAAEPVQQARIITVAADTTSSAEVARDNQMLAAIHNELDASMQSPADAFDLPATMSRPGGGHGQNNPTPSLD